MPEEGSYAVGNIFLPQDAEERLFCKQTIEKIIAEEQQRFLGWREVPINAEGAEVGPAAVDAMPIIEQLFIGSSTNNLEDFERCLYMIRKLFTRNLRQESGLSQAQQLFACSLSSRVIVYKGMLTPAQLFPFYPDLEDPRYKTHLAMVHSRFSTNTFPSWDRAQPNRFMAHNGEINTLRGNINLMSARQGVARSNIFSDINKLFPVVEPDCSDSGSFDNVLEFLLMSGRTLQEALMMMVPEAWQGDENMSKDKRDFYEFHSALMEPWDGPASIAFTDGK